MQKPSCSYCKRNHRTTKCAEYCKRCSKKYDNCGCMEFHVKWWREKGSSILSTGPGARIKLVDSGMSSPGTRPDVAIIVNEWTTDADVKTALPEAKRIRENLLRYRGPWQGGGYNQFIIHLHEKQMMGISYQELADRINSAIFKKLAKTVRFDDPSRSLECSHAVDYLTMLGMNENEAKEEIGWMLDEIREVPQETLEDPSQIDFRATFNPVDKERVYQKLRKWRESDKDVVARTYRAHKLNSSQI